MEEKHILKSILDFVHIFFSPLGNENNGKQQ